MDRWDAMVLAGVLLIAVGLWFVWPPAVLFWLGTVNLAAGLFGASYGSHSRSD